MRVADYIAYFLVEHGIRDLFLISGGGMMHLLDGAAQNKDLNIYCNLNEQATSICAEGYAQYTNQLSACMVTTGPGATNAVTGVAAAWMDSTPILVISGQAKKADMGCIRGLRYYGAQEVPIVPMVEPITKYAVTIMEKELIRYHLEKAVHLATHGRRGPVWLDVPLDIQSAEVEPTSLIGFDPKQEVASQQVHTISQRDMSRLAEMLCASKRPVILLGHGAVASGRGGRIKQLAERLRIPTLSTWRVKGLFGDDSQVYFGHPGIPATRYSNYILQNADFVLLLGTRLNPALTAYNETNFAPHACKVAVDIDRAELEKLSMPLEMSLYADAGDVIERLADELSSIPTFRLDEWLAYCHEMRVRYPIGREKQPDPEPDTVDGYEVALEISKHLTSQDVFVGSSSGRTCGISHMAVQVKEGQRFISSMGLGSMGFTVPMAIGACIASGKSRTVALEGDGSLQHNLQELALIQNYRLPIKLFILSNHGYASIYAMQKNNFNGRFAGCIAENGLIFPSVKKIADTYGLSYMCIRRNGDIQSVLKRAFEDQRPVLCEIVGSIHFDEIPKSMTRVNPDGSFSSSTLENLYPYLPEDETSANMRYW